MNRPSPLPLIAAVACLILAALGGAALVAWDDLAGGGPCPDCPVKPQPQPTPVPLPVKPKPKPEPKPTPRPPCPNCPRFESLPAHGFAQIQLGGPELDGVAVACDFPESQHLRNVGGSDGAGLCVYASGAHGANWAGLKKMAGIFEWMRQHPGGSYPEKWKRTVTQYCRESGIEEPPYVQITDGDIEVLYAATRTRRMACVTYGGRDGVLYRNAKPIGHMVNVLYCDPKVTCILDNNNPGKYLWMDTKSEFVPRWMDNQGGWAIVWEEPGPTPVPVSE